MKKEYENAGCIQVKIIEVTGKDTKELNDFLSKHKDNIVDIQTVGMMYGICKFVIMYKTSTAAETSVNSECIEYALVGYDKDNGAYELFGVHKDLEKLKSKGRAIAKEHKALRTHEPYSWFEIVNANDIIANDTAYPDHYYWASYEDEDVQNYHY